MNADTHSRIMAAEYARQAGSQRFRLLAHLFLLLSLAAAAGVWRMPTQHGQLLAIQSLSMAFAGLAVLLSCRTWNYWMLARHELWDALTAWERQPWQYDKDEPAPEA